MRRGGKRDYTGLAPLVDLLLLYVRPLAEPWRAVRILVAWYRKGRSGRKEAGPGKIRHHGQAGNVEFGTKRDQRRTTGGEEVGGDGGGGFAEEVELRGKIRLQSTYLYIGSKCDTKNGLKTIGNFNGKTHTHGATPRLLSLLPSPRSFMHVQFAQLPAATVPPTYILGRCFVTANGGGRTSLPPQHSLPSPRAKEELDEEVLSLRQRYSPCSSIGRILSPRMDRTPNTKACRSFVYTCT